MSTGISSPAISRALDHFQSTARAQGFVVRDSDECHQGCLYCGSRKQIPVVAWPPESPVDFVNRAHHFFSRPLEAESLAVDHTVGHEQ